MEQSATQNRAARKYRPRPKHEREGVALCLSGGGFRAALFHLGAVRRLNEVGILPQVTTVTAVSGGSMLAAHLAATLPLWRSGPLQDWEEHVAAPFRAFASRNLTTGPIIRGWLLPWYWWTNGAIEEAADRCDQRLIRKRLELHELPKEPRFIFGTVDLARAEGYLLDRVSEPTWSVGRAAAISSCFPIFFRPFQQKKPHRITLADGGLSDNRAVEPVWNTHDMLLVSDGVDELAPSWSASVIRAALVVWDQSQKVRKRWLIANLDSGEMKGAYWGIGSSTENYPPSPSGVAGYSQVLARDVISRIRTTYDAFSEVEAAVLENHGYLLANASLGFLAPLNPQPAPVQIPHSAWMCEQKVADALRDSAGLFPPRY